MKKTVSISAIILLGALVLASAASCGKMDQGVCTCTVTITSENYNNASVTTYPNSTKQACSKMEVSTTDSNGSKLVTKCSYK